MLNPPMRADPAAARSSSTLATRTGAPRYPRTRFFYATLDQTAGVQQQIGRYPHYQQQHHRQLSNRLLS